MMLILYGIRSILIRIKGIKAISRDIWIGDPAHKTHSHIGQILPDLSTILWRPVSLFSHGDPVRNCATIRLRCLLLLCFMYGLHPYPTFASL